MNQIRLRSGTRKLRGEITWTIEDFAEREAVAEPDRQICSPKIVIPDPKTGAGQSGATSYNFQLEMYLKGKDNAQELSLYLERIDTNGKTVMARLTLYLLNELGQKIHERKFTRSFERDGSWGFEKFYPYSKLRSNADRVIVSNALTIGCEIVVMIDYEVAEKDVMEPKEGLKLGDRLLARAREGVMTDLTLICDGKRMACHKFVLAAQSSVFRDLFENSRDDEEELKIDDMKPDVLEKVLEFIYLDKVEIGEDAKALFTAGDKYNIPGLKQLSGVALIRALTPSNAAETLILLDVHGCEAEVAEAAFRFAARHLTEVMQTETWARVVAAHPMVVRGVFKAVAPFQQ